MIFKLMVCIVFIERVSSFDFDYDNGDTGADNQLKAEFERKLDQRMEISNQDLTNKLQPQIKALLHTEIVKKIHELTETDSFKEQLGSSSSGRTWSESELEELNAKLMEDRRAILELKETLKRQSDTLSGLLEGTPSFDSEQELMSEGGILSLLLYGTMTDLVETNDEIRKIHQFYHGLAPGLSDLYEQYKHWLSTPNYEGIARNATRNVTLAMDSLLSLAGSSKISVIVRAKMNLPSWPFDNVPNGILKLPRVTNNTGAAYNPGTGVFTAPFSGTYFFWVAVFALGDPMTKIDLVIEGAVASTLHLKKERLGIEFLYLNNGEKMWLKKTDGSAVLFISMDGLFVTSNRKIL